jgi:hypothetical protein
MSAGRSHRNPVVRGAKPGAIRTAFVSPDVMHHRPARQPRAFETCTAGTGAGHVHKKNRRKERSRGGVQK